MMFLPQLILSMFPAIVTQPGGDHADGCCSAARPDGGTANAGFTEAAFDPGTLQGLTSAADCTGIRFYNVLPTASAQQGTVLAIGIRADGSEINGGILSKPYKMSNGVTGDRVNISSLSESNARQACDRMTASGNTAYAAGFTTADVNDLLRVAGCNGLRISPAMDGERGTFLLTAVNIAGGAMTALGSGSGFERMCGDPCPTVCGPGISYLNVR